MMTKDQADTVKNVFAKLAAADAAETSWTDIDEQMSMLEWLEDTQLAVEAAVVMAIHSKGEPRCGTDHDLSECFVPTLIDAVGIILDLYGKTGNLHDKNKFILRYYLAMSQVGFIRY